LDSAGACEIDGFEKVRPQLMSKYANLVVYGVDKFPRMVDYVIPEGVRIADGDRVRLGAYLHRAQQLCMKDLLISTPEL